MRRSCNVRDCVMGVTPDAAAEFHACLEQLCAGGDGLAAIDGAAARIAMRDAPRRPAARRD